MATRLLKPNQTLVHRKHSLNSVSLRWLRSVSSQSSSDATETTEQATAPAEVKEPVSKWINLRAGLFGPDDKRLPLPGNVGYTCYFIEFNSRVQMEAEETAVAMANLNATLGKGPNPSLSSGTGNHPMVFNAGIEHKFLKTDLEKRIDNIVKAQDILQSYNDGRMLEYKIQKCPHLLKKDFQLMFPHMDMTYESLNVITVCQQTHNDMSQWSTQVEEERDTLVNTFVNSATKICQELQLGGFWADFIDPTAGVPYLGQYSTHTFFETDDRYRHLGFVVEDLGCCKVISHRKWGTRIFVGCMFTNAESEDVKAALLLNSPQPELDPED